MMLEDASDAMQRFFVEDSCDRKYLNESQYAAHIEDMQQLYENDREAILEYAAATSFNPVLGLTYPIHKNILMNTIGLKELYPVIKGMDELDFAIEEIKKNTRHYIKRQISWFKGENSITPIFIDTEYIEEKAFEMLSKFV